MKKVLIIANFTELPSENGNNRFMYLTNLLGKTTDVTLVTSSFYHLKKVHRQKDADNNNLKIVQVDEPGYKKNISLKRFYSHYVFGRNIKKYLDSIEVPDVIYCAIPSLSATKYAAKYAKKHNIPFILDVQDLWPEAFKMVLHIPVVSDIIFYPFSRMANYAYSHADAIVAVSQTYVDRALQCNKKCKDGIAAFLGTNLDEFDSYKSEFCKDENVIKLAYIGTLGASYNINLITEAVNQLKEKYNIKFIVMGEGPLRQEFENYAKQLDAPCEFTGRLAYSEMVRQLTQCDIAVNPITKGSAGSIINKVGDYAAAGLPVINTQECQEYADLLTTYNAGYNCDNTVEDVKEKIEQLINNKELRLEMGKNNRKLAEDKFDRKTTYNKIVELIKSI